MDARGAQWASPYALIGLLTAGQALAEAEGERPLLTVPQQRRREALLGPHRLLRPRRRPVRGARQGAQGGRTGPSDVLLDVTPVRASEDVHEVVGRISETAARILPGELGLERQGDDGVLYGAFGGVPEYC